MLANFKALLVVVVVAAIVFACLKRVAVSFMDRGDFARRRKIWFALTIVAFLSPDFWIYVAIAAPLLIWGAKKDSNPAALYLLLLHVVPPLAVEIPTFGIQRLFALDMYRLLSLCVLLPMTAGLRSTAGPSGKSPFRSIDLWILGYGAIQVATFVRPDIPGAEFLTDSGTNMLRRAFEFVLDVFLPYYIITRSCDSHKKLADTLCAFFLAVAIMAPLAVMESIKHWLFYGELTNNWLGYGEVYLERGETLRAAVSAGHPLALGYLLAIALGFWLYLRTNFNSRRLYIGVIAVLALGLLGAYSRGPWLGAMVIYFSFLLLGPRAMSRLLTGALVAFVAVATLLMSPFGARIVRVIPFLGGTVDVGAIDYRQRLAERSWDIILNTPFFGDPDAYAKLADLRQGQGIVDFVNAYAGEAVFRGLVGLTVFVGFFIFAGWKAYKAMRATTIVNPALMPLGMSLLSCMFGTLVMISTASLIYGYGKMYFVLGALATAYAAVVGSMNPIGLSKVR